MKTAVLIMAGGRGERFWPRSRQNTPKQFLCLTDTKRTMIQCTVDRLRPFVAMEDIFVATGELYRDLVRRQLPDLPEENIIVEPCARNTAACIGLGAVHMRRKYGDAVMLVLPSDHLVTQQKMFQNVIRTASEIAEKTDALITLGITPSSPDTGYGYIRYDMEKPQVMGQAYHVAEFTEKPGLEKARKYLISGDYLWNSGMFIWRVQTILQEMHRWMPGHAAAMEEIGAALGTEHLRSVTDRCFTALPSVSIDYGIMEKAGLILTIPSSFGWDDVGSWQAVARMHEADANGNILDGDAVVLDSEDCIVQGGRRMIAMIGMEHTVVVDTEDALLICDSSHTSDIKKLLEQLRRRGREDLL